MPARCVSTSLMIPRTWFLPRPVLRAPAASPRTKDTLLHPRGPMAFEKRPARSQARPLPQRQRHRRTENHGDHQQHHRQSHPKHESKKQDGAGGTNSKAPAATVTPAAQSAGAPSTTLSQTTIPPRFDMPLSKDVSAFHAVTSQMATSAPSTAKPGRAKHSTPVLAGAIVGGLMLLLLVLSLIACWCRHRKKATAKGKAVRFAPGSDKTTEIGAVKQIDFADFPDDASNRSFHTASQGHHETQPASKQLDNTCPSRNSSSSQPLVHRRGDPSESRPLEEAQDECFVGADADKSDCVHALQDNELTRDEQVNLQRTEDATVDGDELQIDRCLSYYLRHHSRASSFRGADTQDPPPLPDHSYLSHSPAHEGTPDETPRKSLGFTKTGNLLWKIRQSQNRLNEEALFKAKCGDGMDCTTLNGVETETQRRGSDTPSPSILVDQQGQADVPAHWRSSYQLRPSHKPVSDAGDRDVFGSSPHSAFEYADFYDRYMSPSGRSVLSTCLDYADQGSALPWQSNSPCRSSALSPRWSAIGGIRQRSATLSLVSPSRCTANADGFLHATADEEAGSPSGGGLCRASAKQRESEEVGEVIRF